MRLGKGEIKWQHSPFQRIAAYLPLRVPPGFGFTMDTPVKKLNLLTKRTGNTSSVAFQSRWKKPSQAVVQQNFISGMLLVASTKPLSQGHHRNISSVAFSPDGQTLASGARDGDDTVRLWDVETGTLKAAFTGHTGRHLKCSVQPRWKKR